MEYYSLKLLLSVFNQNQVFFPNCTFVIMLSFIKEIVSKINYLLRKNNSNFDHTRRIVVLFVHTYVLSNPICIEGWDNFLVIIHFKVLHLSISKHFS